MRTPRGLKNSRRNSLDDPEEFRATLTEHLDDLRTRIIRSLILLTLGWVAGWFIEPWFYAVLNDLVTRNMKVVLPPGIKYLEIFLNATDAFLLQMKLSLYIGIILTAPFIVLQLWGFVAPGLKPNERKPFKILAPFSVFLFLLGVVFCWFILPQAIQWFGSYVANFKSTELHQEAGKMVFFILKMMLAFGISFQLPIIVYALGALGLLSSETLFQYWRQSTVFIFIASAILTPSNDAFSMLMMAIPMVILFMISVFVVRFTQRKKVAAEGLDEEDAVEEDSVE